MLAQDSVAIKQREKSLLQAVLESWTGRDLDPRRATYTREQKPVGRGYHQAVCVTREENLRTGHVVVTRELGNIV